MSVKDYADFVYRSEKPKDFDLPQDIVKLNVDYDKLQNEHIVIAVPDNFEGSTITGIFTKQNLPKMAAYAVDFNINSGFFEDVIEFNGNIGAKYNIYIDNNGEKVLINNIVCNGDIVRLIIKKDNVFKHYNYFVEYCPD